MLGLISISYNRQLEEKNEKNADVHIMLKHGWLPLQYVMYETIACGSARWSPTKTWKKTATFTLDNERSTDRGKVACLTEIIFPQLKESTFKGRNRSIYYMHK